MTAAMMLPTAAPAAQLARVVRALPAVRFAAGYLVVWTAFGIAAYGLFRHELDATVAAVVVAAAGIYELTPLKQRSLRRCRSAHTPAPAFRSGIAHGVECVGCSAGLMVALIVLGVMSLLWMAVVAAAIFVEKVLPIGPRLSPVIAAALVALGIWLASSPAGVPS
jgi:predicted metal-binding membrane protein